MFILKFLIHTFQVFNKERNTLQPKISINITETVSFINQYISIIQKYFQINFSSFQL